MANININTKEAGNADPSIRKILDTDINQIKGALQTGEYDIYTGNIKSSGTYVRLNDGNMGFRYSDGKVQYSNDGTSWADMGASPDTTFEITAGETLSANDVVYMNPSDNKCYKTDGSNSSKSDWLGVVISDITVDNTGSCFLTGAVVSGFSGLEPGEWYGLIKT